MAKLTKTLEIDPDFWIALLTLAKIYIRQGRHEEALAALSRARITSRGSAQTLSLIGYTCAISGERTKALSALDELNALSEQRYVQPYNIAMIYNGLREDEEAFLWLERAVEIRDVLLSAFVSVDPAWERLRSHARFNAILRRMGLE